MAIDNRNIRIDPELMALAKAKLAEARLARSAEAALADAGIVDQLAAFDRVAEQAEAVADTRDVETKLAEDIASH